MDMPGVPTIQDILNDNTASYWLKEALTTALKRDAVDAAQDATILAQLLNVRCNQLLRQ